MVGKEDTNIPLNVSVHAHFLENPSDMLGCMIVRYNGMTQPIEEQSSKMESKR